MNAETIKDKKLRRSQNDRFLFGICGGLADYFGTSSVWIRLLFIVLFFVGWEFIVLYIILAFVIPIEEAESNQTEKGTQKNDFLILTGIIIMVIGVGILSYNHLNLPFVPDITINFPHNHGMTGLIKIIVLVFAVIILLNYINNKNEGVQKMENGEVKKLYLSEKDKKIWGVCGGLAEYFNIDSTIVRILFVAFSLLWFGSGVIVYVLMKLIVPSKPTN